MTVKTKMGTVINVSIFLISITIFLISVFTARNMAEKLIEFNLLDKLKCDIKSANLYYEKYFGKLQLINGELIDANGKSISNNFESVDRITENLGDVTTVFMKKDDDFIRIITTVKKEDGTRAVGTMLGKNSKAYDPVINGKLYIGEADILGKSYFTAYDPIKNESDNVIGIIFIGVTKTESNKIAGGFSNKLIFRNFFALAILIPVSVILIMLMINSLILNHLKKASGTSNILSEGDLTVKFDKLGKDEIGDMNENFNKFLDRLMDIVVKIKINLKENNEHLKNLIEAMSRSKSSADDINNLAVNVKEVIINQASVISEVSSTIENISATIEKQDIKINSQAANVSESSAAISEMIENIKSIGNNLNNSSKEFDDLQNAVKSGSMNLNQLKDIILTVSMQSDEVLDANEAIKNIAAQIDLLAMNAAIEASHAGEAGKGFAVVADEVRNLAEVSNEQSKIISENLDKLKASIESSVELSEKAGLSFDIIIKKAETVTNIEKEIKNSLDEQDIGHSEVMKALKDISQITEEVHSGSNEMLAGSKAIINEIQGLIEVTGNVKDFTVKVAEKAEDVKDIVDKSVELLNLNIESIKKVDALVSVFKTGREN